LLSPYIVLEGAAGSQSGTEGGMLADFSFDRLTWGHYFAIEYHIAKFNEFCCRFFKRVKEMCFWISK